MTDKKIEGLSALLDSASAQRTSIQRAMHGLLTTAALSLLASCFFISLLILPWLSRRSFYSMPAQMWLLLVVVTALTAVALGLWRLYLKRLDHDLAHLYPDLYLYESLLGAPSRRGTARYLRRSVPKLRFLLEDESASTEVKAEALGLLAESRRFGERGLRRGNVISLVIMGLMGLMATLAVLAINAPAFVACFVLPIHLVGFIFLYGAFSRFQREPTDEMVWKALQRARTRSEKKEEG